MKKNQKHLPANPFQTAFSMFAMLLICFTIGTTQRVSASDTGVKPLKQNKIYKNYDVTGDNKKDTIKITVKKKKDRTYDHRETLRIEINHSTALKLTDYNSYNWNTNIIFLQNNMVLFDISNLVDSDDVGIHELFQWKNGALKSIYDLQGNTCLGYSYNHYVYADRVTGNTLHCRVMTQFLTTGGFLHFELTIKYQNGKFTIPPVSHKIKYKKAKYNKWTANKKMTIYQNAGSKTVAYLLKKGDKIKINRVIYRGKKIYFQIKNKNGKGQVGYLPADKHISEPYSFQETVYSG